MVKLAMPIEKGSQLSGFVVDFWELVEMSLENCNSFSTKTTFREVYNLEDMGS